MATGTNRNGSTVSVGDRVSISGKVVSVTGSGSNATVVVQAPLDVSTVSIKANDAYTTEHSNDATHLAISYGGKYYGVAGNSVTIMGRVTAITGSGQNAIMTVTLISSGNSITTAAGNCNSVTA